MAKKEQLYNKKGEKVYPITSTECVVDGDKKLSERLKNLNADTVGGLSKERLTDKILYNANSANGGVLIKTSVKVDDDYGRYILIRINGITYNSPNKSISADSPIDTVFQTYFYKTPTAPHSFNETCAINNGYPIPEIKVFEYQGYVCLWFAAIKNTHTYSAYGNATLYGRDDEVVGNAIEAITNVPMPTEGVTLLQTITPVNSATTGSGKCLGVVDLPATTSTLDTTTLPPIADVGTLILRYNGVVQDLESYIAPKQEGGIPIPQSDGINTLDLVNNAVPLANLNEYVGVPNNWLKIYVPMNYFFEYIDTYPTLSQYFHPINQNDDEYKYTYYNGLSGLLIKTFIKDTIPNSNIELNLIGICGANADETPFDTIISFWYYPDDTTRFSRCRIFNKGNKGIKVVKAFTYNGYIYLHIEKPDNYILFKVKGIRYNRVEPNRCSIDKNVISTLQNAVIPSGAEHITPFSITNVAVESDLNTPIEFISEDTLHAYPNKQYTFRNPVGNLSIKLIDNENFNEKVVNSFSVYLTTGDNPNIDILSAKGNPIKYMQGYSIAPNTTYELNFMFNGLNWVVSYGIIE